MRTTFKPSKVRRIRLNSGHERTTQMTSELLVHKNLAQTPAIDADIPITLWQFYYLHEAGMLQNEQSTIM